MRRPGLSQFSDGGGGGGNGGSRDLGGSVGGTAGGHGHHHPGHSDGGSRKGMEARRHLDLDAVSTTSGSVQGTGCFFDAFSASLSSDLPKF